MKRQLQELSEPRLAHLWNTHLCKLESYISVALHDLGIDEDRDGANLFADMWAEEAMRDLIVTSAEGKYPPHLRGEDRRMAIREHRLSDSTLIRWDLEAKSLPAPWAPMPGKERHWRRYDLRTAKNLTGVVQMRDLEAQLKYQWIDRLLNILLPHATGIPALSERKSWDNHWREYHDLFGDARWGALQGHVTNLESMRKFKPDLVV